MEAFARALRALPTIICDNAGLDSADIVATLRAVRAAVVRGAGVRACPACVPPPARAFGALAEPPRPPLVPQEHGKDPDTTRAGVDVLTGAAGDMSRLGIFESFRVKNQARGGCKGRGGRGAFRGGGALAGEVGAGRGRGRRPQQRRQAQGAAWSRRARPCGRRGAGAAAAMAGGGRRRAPPSRCPLPPANAARAPRPQVVTSAVEAAEVVLRVDDIIRAAPRRRG